MQDRIEREVEISAPVTRVWAALTEAEHLGTWFGDAGAKVDLRPGGAITFSWQKYGTAHAVIERVDPPRFFSYRWALVKDAAPAPGNSTLVEFTLVERAGGTLLRLVESGFSGLDMTDEEKARRVGENGSGWTKELAELEEYLTGLTVG
jgi:uncharacterized protein YndB with AHSA1/START domain